MRPGLQTCFGLLFVTGVAAAAAPIKSRPDAGAVRPVQPAGRAEADANAKAMKPAQPWKPETQSTGALVEQFRAASSANVNAATAAANAYLSQEPRDPSVAREMLAWLSAVQSLSASKQLDGPEPGLEQLQQQALASVRAAVEGSRVKVNITLLTMNPASNVKVSTFYETKVWTFSKVDVTRPCHLKVSVTNERTTINVGEPEQKRPPDQFNSTLEWDLSRLEPKDLKLVSGATMEASEIHLFFPGERSVRAASPEYFLLTTEENPNYIRASGLVFVDPSVARNVAAALVRAVVLCHEKSESQPAAPQLASMSAAGNKVGSKSVAQPKAEPHDRWEYVETVISAEGQTGKGTVTREVVEATATEIKVREVRKSPDGNSMASLHTLDRDWNLLRMTALGVKDPIPLVWQTPLAELKFPLSVGLKWKHHAVSWFEMEGNRSTTESDLEVEALGWESVTTPAGTWQALKLRTRTSSAGGYVSDRLSWFVPEVKAVVRQSATSTFEGASSGSSTLELVKHTTH